MLKGDRVILRAMRPDDLERFMEFRNDVELSLLAGWLPAPVSLSQLQHDLDATVDRPASDVTWFAIDAQGRFIGQCLLHNFDPTARSCELGISIGDRDFWNQGYGRDAVRLLLKYAFRLRNLERVWLTVNASNGRAVKAFTAAGFVEEGRLRRHVWLDGAFDDLVHMGILREDWQHPAWTPIEEDADAKDGA
jgi:RimJ/RimL family protein N-acetyltransferase